MHVLSRQQLFDMAWARPRTKVAADLGVTSTALKKTCRRHNIPTPSRGYWAAVAAGGVFPKPKLSPVSRKEGDPGERPTLFAGSALRRSRSGSASSYRGCLEGTRTSSTFCGRSVGWSWTPRDYA